CVTPVSSGRRSSAIPYQASPGHLCATEQGRPIGRRVGEPRPIRQTPELLAPHPAPEFLQPVEAMLGLVARDQTGVDGANRRADDPIRLHPRLMQGLLDARLVGAERAAALENKDDL